MGSRMVMGSPSVRAHDQRPTPGFGQSLLVLWLGDSYWKVRPHTKAERGGPSVPRLLRERVLTASALADQHEQGRQ
jgi:hypothetical protein